MKLEFSGQEIDGLRPLIELVAREVVAEAMKGRMTATTDCQANDQRLFTYDEASVYLSVSPRTVAEYKRRGTLRSVKIGTAGVRFDRADLDALIEKSKSQN